MLEQKRQTCLEKYGVLHISQIVDVKQKKHATRKRNGTYRKSYAEDRFCKFLVENYGEITRWPVVNNWSIDFYVPKLNTWVQFDGTYWHGLNRPYELLSQKEKYWFDKDREQDQWFLSRNMRLVRITDKQLGMCLKTSDWNDIMIKLGAT